MKVKSLLYFLVLFAYTLFLAHSVVPHAHFESFSEFRNTHTHHHNDHGSSHQQHSDEQSNHDHEAGGLLVLAHATNFDFAPNIFKFSKPAVEKNHPYCPAAISSVYSRYESFAKPVFHVPIEPPPLRPVYLSSRSLRAPPSYLS